MSVTQGLICNEEVQCCRARVRSGPHWVHVRSLEERPGKGCKASHDNLSIDHDGRPGVVVVVLGAQSNGEKRRGRCSPSSAARARGEAETVRRGGNFGDCGTQPWRGGCHGDGYLRRPTATPLVGGRTGLRRHRTCLREEVGRLCVKGV